MVKDWARAERRLNELTTCEASNNMRKLFYRYLVLKFGYLDALTVMADMKIGSPYYKRAANLIREVANERSMRGLR
jgi:hypothetical protein